MMEIERKILEIDKAALLLKINALRPKAQKLFEGIVRVRYFDFPDGRIKKKRDLLRVREFERRGGKTFCEVVYKTYKGVKKNSKFFDELEFKLAEPAAFELMADFLVKLGFRPTLHYEKMRTLFAYKNVKIEIDEHPKIPAFVEIEAPSPAAIDGMIKALGLEKFEKSAETIGELIARKYPKVKLDGLKF